MCFLLASAGSAVADTVAAPGTGGGWRLAIGPAAGALVLDSDLANYRWDTRPTVISGIGATLHRGRLAAGLRYRHGNTTQGTGIPDTGSLRVSLDTFDVIGQARIVDRWGLELWGAGFAGRTRIGYHPDELTFDTGTAVGTVTVGFDPISEWQFGTGLEMRRELTGALVLSLQGEVSTFALDTAHRRGGEIVDARERFYSWSLWMQLSWMLSLS